MIEGGGTTGAGAWARLTPAVPYCSAKMEPGRFPVLPRGPTSSSQLIDPRVLTGYWAPPSSFPAPRWAERRCRSVTSGGRVAAGEACGWRCSAPERWDSEGLKVGGLAYFREVRGARRGYVLRKERRARTAGRCSQLPGIRWPGPWDRVRMTGPAVESDGWDASG